MTERDEMKAKGAPRAEMGVTDLMRAATEPDVTILLRMLASNQHNADLFIRDNKGRTALDWARMCRNYQAVTVLLQAINTQLNDARFTAVSAPLDLEHHLREANHAQSQELEKALKRRDKETALRILIDNQLHREEVKGCGEVFFVDAQYFSGYTPLIIAAGFNMLDVVHTLIEDLEVDLETQNKFGHTALTYACAAGNSDVVRLLLFHGANIHHTTSEGRTGLHFACLYAKARTVKTLLQYMLETFATFRIEEHSMTDFDHTRWTRYADIMDQLINVSHIFIDTTFICLSLGGR